MAQEEERRKTGIGDVLGLVAGRLYEARYVLGVSVALAVLLLVFDGMADAIRTAMPIQSCHSGMPSKTRSSTASATDTPRT